jgi:hypothetical protein
LVAVDVFKRRRVRNVLPLVLVTHESVFERVKIEHAAAFVVGALCYRRSFQLGDKPAPMTHEAVGWIGTDAIPRDGCVEDNRVEQRVRVNATACPSLPFCHVLSLFVALHSAIAH